MSSGLLTANTIGLAGLSTVGFEEEEEEEAVINKVLKLLLLLLLLWLLFNKTDLLALILVI